MYDVGHDDGTVRPVVRVGAIGGGVVSASLDHGGDPEITDEVRALAQVAITVSRSEGCDCVAPVVEMTPTAEEPWWSPVVRHDESCALIRKLRDDPEFR